MSANSAEQSGSALSEPSWKLNPGLRFYPFDSRRADDWLVELDDASGRTHRMVVSCALHHGLQRLAEPMSLPALRALLATEGWDEPALDALVAALEDDCRQRRLIVLEDAQPAPAIAQRVRPRYMAAMLQLLPPTAVNPLARLLSPLFSAWGAGIGLVSAAVGFYLLFDSMRTHRSFSSPSPEDVLLTLGLGAVTLLLHELGHAAAAWRAGARKVSIGVGWYVLFPVAYADLSETWRLPAGRRIAINLAGVYMQSIALLALMLAYTATGHAAVLATGAATAASMAWNLNPLIRLDGYWVLSDLLKTTDLRQEALRALLDGWGRWRGRTSGHHTGTARALPPVTAALLGLYALVCAAFFVAVVFVALGRFSGALMEWIRSGPALWSSVNLLQGSWAAIALMVGALCWKLALTWFTGRFLLANAHTLWRWAAARIRPERRRLGTDNGLDT